jgi:hypothetical protein
VNGVRNVRKVYGSASGKTLERREELDTYLFLGVKVISFTGGFPFGNFVPLVMVENRVC